MAKFFANGGEMLEWKTGFTLSDDLTWNSHVEKVIKKGNSRLYALRQRNMAGLSQTDLVTLFCSFVRSTVEYAAPAWWNITLHLSDLIESIQKRALQIIYLLLTYEDALARSGFRTLVTRREDLCKSFMCKLRANDINVYNNPVAKIVNSSSQVPDLAEHNYQPMYPSLGRTGLKTL